MKRIIAVLLALMMALGLTACSGDDNAQVAGTWKWNCDITELFQEGVNQGAGMDLSVDAAVEMVFVLALNEDGTYTLSVDRDALSGSVRSYLDAMVPVAVEMVYQQLEDQGMNRADIDEAMAAEGTSVEEYVQQMLDAMDVDQMVDGLEDESESGYFRAAKGKLYLSDKADTFSDDSYAEYTLSGGTMQWTGGDSSFISELADINVELPYLKRAMHPLIARSISCGGFSQKDTQFIEKEQEDFRINFLTIGITQYVLEWIESDFREPIEDMVAHMSWLLQKVYA